MATVLFRVCNPSLYEVYNYIKYIEDPRNAITSEPPITFCGFGRSFIYMFLFKSLLATTSHAWLNSPSAFQRFLCFMCWMPEWRSATCAAVTSRSVLWRFTNQRAPEKLVTTDLTFSGTWYLYMTLNWRVIIIIVIIMYLLISQVRPLLPSTVRWTPQCLSPLPTTPLSVRAAASQWGTRMTTCCSLPFSRACWMPAQRATRSEQIPFWVTEPCSSFPFKTFLFCFVFSLSLLICPSHVTFYSTF